MRCGVPFETLGDAMTVKIYRMDDYESYYAAESLEAAKAFYSEISESPADDDQCWEVDLDAEQFNVHPSEPCYGLTGGVYSFRVALAAALESGATAPFLFAVAE